MARGTVKRTSERQRREDDELRAAKVGINGGTQCPMFRQLEAAGMWVSPPCTMAADRGDPPQGPFLL